MARDWLVDANLPAVPNASDVTGPVIALSNVTGRALPLSIGAAEAPILVFPGCAPPARTHARKRTHANARSNPLSSAALQSSPLTLFCRPGAMTLIGMAEHRLTWNLKTVAGNHPVGMMDPNGFFQIKKARVHDAAKMLELGDYGQRQVIWYGGYYSNGAFEAARNSMAGLSSREQVEHLEKLMRFAGLSDFQMLGFVGVVAKMFNTLEKEVYATCVRLEASQSSAQLHRAPLSISSPPSPRPHPLASIPSPFLTSLLLTTVAAAASLPYPPRCTHRPEHSAEEKKLFVERFEALRPTLFGTLATAYMMVALAAKSQNFKMGIWEIDWAPVVQSALEGKLALHPRAVDSHGDQGNREASDGIVVALTAMLNTTLVPNKAPTKKAAKVKAGMDEAVAAEAPVVEPGEVEMEPVDLVDLFADSSDDDEGSNEKSSDGSDSDGAPPAPFSLAYAAQSCPLHLQHLAVFPG